MEEKNEEQKSSQNIDVDKQLEKRMEQNEQKNQKQNDEQNEKNIEIKDTKQSEEKDEDLGITFIKGPVGPLPIKFRRSKARIYHKKNNNNKDQEQQDINKQIQINNLKKVMPNQKLVKKEIIRRPWKTVHPQDEIEGLNFQGNMTQFEERIIINEPICSPGIYKITFKVQIPPKIRHPHEPKPAFFVGIVEDGREDKDNFSEQKGVYKKIFGSNNQKVPDNKGMMSNIEGVYEYNYDIEQDLTPDSDTVMSVVLDFDKNIFRILTPAKKNIHQSLKKFLNLNERDWRVYFGWLECSSSVTILEVRRTETKIKPKDKYGREIDI